MVVREEIIPIVEERVVVGKRVHETGRVHVRTRTETREDMVHADLTRDEVDIERVPMNLELERVPDVRQEGDVTIVPVVEEILVVEKRLMLVEEIRLRRRQTTEQVSQPVTVATQHAEVDRSPVNGNQDAIHSQRGA